MDFTIDQASFARALRLVGRAVPTRPSLPILQSVLVEAEPGRLKLVASDVGLALATWVAADVATAGRTAVPARLLGEYIAQLPPQQLRLCHDAGKRMVRVTCERFRANIAAFDPDDYPPLPAADEGAAISIDAHRLRGAIERVAFAAAQDDGRPVLTAVLFDFDDRGLTLAAADGFRLARARLPEAAGPARQWLVPARAVAELGRLLADVEAAQVAPTQDGNGVRVSLGETVLFSRLIEGRFPDVEWVVPQGYRTRATVEAAAFRQAVRVAALFGGSGEARPVRLEAAPGRLHLKARGDEAGEAESEVLAAVEGEAQTVVLNTRLLADLLDAVEGRQIEVSWAGPQTPVVFRQAGQANPTDLSIVMPLHDPALARQNTA